MSGLVRSDMDIISDFIDRNGELIPFSYLKTKGLTINWFQHQQIINAIPKCWKQILKMKQQSSQQKDENMLELGGIATKQQIKDSHRCGV